MSSYARWSKLNESLSFPLGVSSLSSLGVSGGFQAYEESKKKKKMDIGDEIPADEPEGEEDADDEEGESKGKKLPPWLQKKGHDEPDGDEGGEGCCSCHAKGDEHKPFCKKAKKGMKKSKKQMQEEMFAPYQDCQYEQFPEVGSDEYRDAFFKSVAGHMGAPGKRHWSGVDLGEEVLFQPENDQLPQQQVPTAGQVGYAPVGRVGGDLGPAAQAKPEWEQQWRPIADEMQGLIDQWDSFQSRLK